MHDDLRRHVGKFYGKYSGVVVENDAEANDDDAARLGWITVQVPAVFGPELKVRARPCFASGHFFVPVPQTSVWIEFEAGNPAFPLWVGTWYARDALPPEADVLPPKNHVIHTPAGHVIEIMDKQGEEKITIRHTSNAFVSLDKTGSVLLSNKNGSHLFLDAEHEQATFTEQHGNIMVMSADGVVITNSDGTTLVELKSGKVRISGKEVVQVSGTSIVLDGSSIGLGANATQSVLLGELFMALYNAHTHATALGPSGPPLPPLTPTAFSQSVKVKP